MASWCLIAVLIASLLVCHTWALYNTMSTWDRRCFIEDVPDNTMISFKWSLHIFDTEKDDYDRKPSKDSKLYLFIKKLKMLTTDTTSSLRREQELKNGEGTIHFYAEEFGEYEWCFEMHPKVGDEWEMDTARFYMNVTRQYQDEEKEKIEDTQDAIIHSLQRNLRKVKQIRMEQKYYKGREHEFRGISYLTSTRVVWYGALTALTVISCGCFMMKNMTSFFISKKLV